MTQRIYYSEPYRRSFDATVLSVETLAGHSLVTLDQTAFYPTSGGQPFDTGTLGGAAVSDVIDREDGTIAHVVSGSLKAGEIVSGEIDWARRFDHMQQHTGQHVLSAAFDRLFGVRTESFHMGQLSSTIDLGREVSESEIARAEDDANRIVWEDRPVAIRFATAEEAAAMPLRKESGRTGALRLIDVQDYDLSACGGTHVERTGAIGVIAIGSWEKFKGGSRIEFLCGGRALQRFRVWRGALSAVQKHLSVPPIEMAASIERMQDEAKAVQRTVRGFQEKLATHEAQAIIARARRAGDTLVIAEALDGWDPQGLKSIAVAATAAQPYAVVALFTSSTPAQVVIARGANAKADAGALLKQLTAKFGGKGGGKPDLAQGGGLVASGKDLADFVDALFDAGPEPAPAE
jgi:alanyl-tRNA synthetase